MEVICEMMRLKPESVKDYIDLHDNTWPDLVIAIREAGFIEEYIYILDNLVMVVMKCENFKDSFSKLEETDVFKDWDIKVREMLISDEPFFTQKMFCWILAPFGDWITLMAMEF